MSAAAPAAAEPPTIVALVPMKGHSERVPGKNYRDFNGRPLYHHTISMLLSVPAISKVVVNTDSDELRAGIAEAFPTVQLVARPERLQGDFVPMNEILLYDTEQEPADYYLQTHSTNPLLKAETVTAAIEAFLAKVPECDSLFGVKRLQTRLYDQLGRAINHNPSVLLRTQDLPPVYEENSCIYLFDAETLRRRRNRIGDRPHMFEISDIESTDIDTETDFQLAELLGRLTSSG